MVMCFFRVSSDTKQKTIIRPHCNEFFFRLLRLFEFFFVTPISSHKLLPYSIRCGRHVGNIA